MGLVRNGLNAAERYSGVRTGEPTKQLATKRLLTVSGALGAEVNCRDYGDWSR